MARVFSHNEELFAEAVIKKLNKHFNLSIDDAIDEVDEEGKIKSYLDENDILVYCMRDYICPNNKDFKLQIFKFELTRYMVTAESPISFEEAFEETFDSIDDWYEGSVTDTISEEEFKAYCLAD